MTLELVIKIVGFVLVGAPLAAFLFISIHMFRGAMNDDEVIKGLVMLGGTVLLIGVGILILIYSTEFFPALLNG